MSGKSIVAIRCFLIPKRNNSGFGKLDRRIYRRHREIRFCPAETSKIAPKAYSRKWPWLFPCFSKTQRERRCQPYPVCLNISREKPVLKKSYSVLQDDFYNAMRSAGYTDLERGERGSSEEHLTVTQFKVEREQERLEGLTEQTAQKAQEAAVLGKKLERYQKQQVAIQKVDAIEAKPVPLSSTKVTLERKEYEALKATAKKYIAQEKREGVLQKALDAAKGLINELKAEIASLREELSYYRSPKFQMKLHKIEKENDVLRDKLRVYNAIIDRFDLGRFFGKNRSPERNRNETGYER